METQRAHYQADMLGMWQEQDEVGPVWWASLERPNIGERHGFASLEDLFWVEGFARRY